MSGIGFMELLLMGAIVALPIGGLAAIYFVVRLALRDQGTRHRDSKSR